MQPDFNIKTIQLIAGLGNPEERYRETYHNVGALLADALAGAGRYENISRKHFVACSARGMPIIKPSIAMNEAGKAVREAADFYTVTPRGILVLHDDSDLALGSLKLHFGRG